MLPVSAARQLYQLTLILGTANVTPIGRNGMASIVVVGAGLGGMSAAFELRDTLGRDHSITVVGQGDRFAFTPSNPWVAIGWREPEATSLDAAECLARRGIAFNGSGVDRID